MFAVMFAASLKPDKARQTEVMICRRIKFFEERTLLRLFLLLVLAVGLPLLR
jgi:hypothetical protein